MLGDSVDYINKREVRFDSICKMKTSIDIKPSKDRISIECCDKALQISEQISDTPSVVSAEMARVQANLEFDLILQEMKHYMVLNVWLLTGACYVLDSAGYKIRVDNYLIKEGSRTKLDISLNLIALIERNYKFIVELLYILINLGFNTSGAQDFRIIIEKRWEKLRREPSNPEQAWLIPQPSRNFWGDSRLFTKES